MGNGSHACVLGVGIVILKFTSGKDDAIEERAACPLHQKESCWWLTFMSRWL
jgi:hypothetical protein